MNERRELVIDCFAGGGGASTGIAMAIGRSPDVGINHDPEALALHAANHPDTRHYPDSVFDLDPLRVLREVLGVDALGVSLEELWASVGFLVGLGWFSPDCKHFSKAKGTALLDRRIRGLAYMVLKWVGRGGGGYGKRGPAAPRVIELENVEEFVTWGPLYPRTHPDPKKAGRPIPEKAGLYFRRFVRDLRAFGYHVEWREMRAADYGAPTTRKRFFLVARCDGRPIVWSQPSHGKARPKPWRVAAEIMDWSLPCPSIFMTREEARLFKRATGIQVRRPLAAATLRRIARGVWKYVIDAAEPFIVPVSHAGDARVHSVHEPLRTITGSSRANHALVTPIVSSYYGARGRPGDDRAVPLDRPLPTQTTENRFALISPTLIQTGYGEDKKRNGGVGQTPRVPGLDKPLGTVVGCGVRHALVAAFLAKHYGGKEGRGGSALNEPVDTVTAKDRHAVVSAEIEPIPTFEEWYAGTKAYGGSREEYDRLYGDSAPDGAPGIARAAHVAKHYGDRVGSSVTEPLHTVTADSVHHALVTSSLVKLKGTARDGQSVANPLHTVQAGGQHYGEVRAFLSAYYGSESERGASLRDPMRTITAHDRLALVTVHGAQYAIVDIGMRMLSPRELYRAQGFEDDFIIDILFNGKPLTTTAQVRMCGNSVPPHLAYALTRDNYGDRDVGERAA